MVKGGGGGGVDELFLVLLLVLFLVLLLVLLADLADLLELGGEGLELGAMGTGLGTGGDGVLLGLCGRESVLDDLDDLADLLELRLGRGGSTGDEVGASVGIAVEAVGDSDRVGDVVVGALVGDAVLIDLEEELDLADLLESDLPSFRWCRCR